MHQWTKTIFAYVSCAYVVSTFGWSILVDLSLWLMLLWHFLLSKWSCCTRCFISVYFPCIWWLLFERLKKDKLKTSNFFISLRVSELFCVGCFVTELPKKKIDRIFTIGIFCINFFVYFLIVIFVVIFVSSLYLIEKSKYWKVKLLKWASRLTVITISGEFRAWKAVGITISTNTWW